jgi:hypothetical protein
MYSPSQFDELTWCSQFADKNTVAVAMVVVVATTAAVVAAGRGLAAVDIAA